MQHAKACVIAGTHSGCGKTSVSLGLMRSLSRNGFKVQPFKCGPDFIDPTHHALACSRPSHNIDGWMLPEAVNRDIFHRYAADADVAVVEGVMGMHDGFSGRDDLGSTAHMARQLALPVVLVVDVRSMARSAAALIQGYADFDPRVRVAGVICNRVGSKNHEDIIREAMEGLPHIPVLGFLRRSEEIELPSRHLGLFMGKEQPENMYDRLADWIEESMDPKSLLDSLAPYDIVPPDDPAPREPVVRLGVARDHAFCFYYEENLRLLREAGAELVEFSPLEDKKLPDDLDGLYFGGGYPELFSFELGQNTRMRKAVGEFHKSGRPIYGECGGFMYLMEDIVSRDRGRFSMAGIFPVRALMDSRFRALGYREIETRSASLLGPAGTVARGHEFHYSGMKDGKLPENARPIYALRDRKGPKDVAEGFLAGNTLGSYVHLHFGGTAIAAGMVEFALSCR